MNRPARKLKHLKEKLATKTARTKRPGGKAKRWNKAVAAFSQAPEAPTAT